ncbi:MAG TPA: ATP-binding protein [Chitinophagaceae bacterium]|nr:ATP-binding protein [Chitinophagaceae bacterium]
MSPLTELKKIVVLGPESTGKSTLCEDLAQHYNTLWCPEFAREYLLTHGKEYDYNNLLTIAKGQVTLEDEYAAKVNSQWAMGNQQASDNSPLTIHHSPLFVDTNMYVMKVWCEFVFDNCHRFILDQIVERKYDLYLLCNIDLPWAPDELREYPDLATRQKLYHMYEDLMINQDIPWVDISGDREERLAKAVKATNAILKAV